MKILLINNYHYLRGGSERVYFDTARILEANGHEVAFFSTKNEKNRPSAQSRFFVDAPDFSDPSRGLKDKLKIVGNIFYNREAKKKLSELIDEFKPDAAHLHNVYHHLSPSVIDALAEKGVPSVLTLHDYKLISPSYNLLVRGKIWEGSKPKRYWRCFADRCVQDSYLKSLVAAAESYYHGRKKIYEQVDRFVSPSRFLIKKFKEYGFAEEIKYLPNPIFPEEMAGEAGESGYILYYGRLSEEKGVLDLIEAYRLLAAPPKLKIVGDGPLRENILKVIKEKKIRGVELAPRQEGAKLWGIIRGAALVVVPSRWYENAPYAALEPLALGKTVLASRLGGLAEIIRDGENGFSFQAGDVGDLKAKIEHSLANPEIGKRLGEAAAGEIGKKNSADSYYQGLEEVYWQAIKRNKAKR